MIRIRLQKGLTEGRLMQAYGFVKVNDGSRTYFKKNLGSYEIQVKLSYPENLRIQNWADSRAPWILFKFLLDLEAKKDIHGKIRIYDEGHYRVLGVQETLDLISELSQYTDLKHRLTYWYKQFMKGKLQIP